jgi:hypothetical protein
MGLEESGFGLILGHRPNSVRNFDWLPFTPPSGRLLRSFNFPKQVEVGNSSAQHWSGGNVVQQATTFFCITCQTSIPIEAFSVGRREKCENNTGIWNVHMRGRGA